MSKSKTYGKRLWEIVRDGQTRISNTPEDFWNQACEYFQWCDDSDMEIRDYVTSGKTAGSEYKRKNDRPYSIMGLCLYCGINMKYFNDLMDMPDDNMYKIVAERISYIILEQNFSNAAIGNYSASFMNRLLENSKPPTPTKAITVNIVSTGKSLENSEYIDAEEVIEPNEDFS